MLKSCAYLKDKQTNTKIYRYLVLLQRKLLMLISDYVKRMKKSGTLLCKQIVISIKERIRIDRDSQTRELIKRNID